MSFNKIIVLGNLTRDPELKYTPQGTPVCTLNLASNEKERDPKTKEQVDRATFFKATAWGQKAEVIAKHFEKGSEIYLEGRFKPEEWTDREGQKRTTFGIQVSDFNFTGGSNRREPRGQSTTSPQPSKSIKGSDEESDIDDSDIPF